LYYSVDGFRSCYRQLTLTVYVLRVYVTVLSDHAVAQADILRSEKMFKFQESLCKFAVDRGERGLVVFLRVFVYPLSLSFHPSSTLIFIYAKDKRLSIDSVFK
jgi:hypothetical protein